MALRLARRLRSKVRAAALRIPATVQPRPDDASCPVCRGRFRTFLTFRGRPGAQCPSCGALERHRALWTLISGDPELRTPRSVLHLAPEQAIGRLLRGRAERYVTGDLVQPADLRLDLTRMPFPSFAFDLVVCCHVLEHIPDDAAAMRELGRITRPGGTVLIQVPWVRGSRTDEDPDASDVDRLHRFGQVDHVRIYGQDIVDRLEQAGLATRVIDALDAGGRSGALPPTSATIFVGRPR